LKKLFYEKRDVLEFVEKFDIISNVDEVNVESLTKELEELSNRINALK